MTTIRPCRTSSSSFNSAGRSIDRAGEPAIVVAVSDQLPAFVRLTLDVSLGGLALVVERVELLLQAAVGRYAGVDRAAQVRLSKCRLHGAASERGGDECVLADFGVRH